MDDEDRLTELAIAGLYADAGKLQLPESLLNHDGTLTEEQWERMREHPRESVAILGRFSLASEPVIRAVLAHHERWDGSGYPKGLVGEAIFEPARIIAVADTYFDLVSVHPRRPAAMPHEAVEYVMGSSGELLAPALVEVFVREVPLYPTGVTVRLNTGELGIVSNGNLGFVGRPTVRICMDADSRPIKEPYDFDLSDPEHQGTLVVQVVDY